MSVAADISDELERAEAARASGNEGQARVCARRAAGMAAEDFLNRKKVSPFFGGRDRTLLSKSTYRALQVLATFPLLAPHLKQAALHLTMRVNGDFHLPDGIDLIDEAHKIIGGLK